MELLHAIITLGQRSSGTTVVVDDNVLSCCGGHSTVAVETLFTTFDLGQFRSRMESIINVQECGITFLSSTQIHIRLSSDLSSLECNFIMGHGQSLINIPKAIWLHKGMNSLRLLWLEGWMNGNSYAPELLINIVLESSKDNNFSSLHYINKQLKP